MEMLGFELMPELGEIDADHEFAQPANGHIEVTTYTVTVGRASVVIRRQGAMWTLDGGPVASLVPLPFPDGGDSHEHMMKVAVEYAKRLDQGMQLRHRAEAHDFATRTWLQDQAYRSNEQTASAT